MKEQTQRYEKIYGRNKKDIGNRTERWEKEQRNGRKTKEMKVIINRWEANKINRKHNKEMENRTKRWAQKKMGDRTKIWDTEQRYGSQNKEM